MTATPSAEKPKLSGHLNNCGLHALAPSIVEAINTYANATEDRLRALPLSSHKAKYDQLKTLFCQYYGITGQEATDFNFKKFSAALGTNTYEQQVLLGPVLRSFMAESIQNILVDGADNIRKITEAYNNMPQDYRSVSDNTPEKKKAKMIQYYTKIQEGQLNYEPLTSDELAVYAAKPLGISVTENHAVLNLEEPVLNPITKVTIYNERQNHWRLVPLGNEEPNPPSWPMKDLFEFQKLPEPFRRVGEKLINEYMKIKNSNETEQEKAGKIEKLKLDFNEIYSYYNLSAANENPNLPDGLDQYLNENFKKEFEYWKAFKDSSFFDASARRLIAKYREIVHAGGPHKDTQIAKLDRTFARLKELKDAGDRYQTKYDEHPDQIFQELLGTPEEFQAYKAFEAIQNIIQTDPNNVLLKNAKAKLKTELDKILNMGSTEANVASRKSQSQQLQAVCDRIKTLSDKSSLTEEFYNTTVDPPVVLDARYKALIPSFNEFEINKKIAAFANYQNQFKSMANAIKTKFDDLSKEPSSEAKTTKINKLLEDCVLLENCYKAHQSNTDYQADAKKLLEKYGINLTTPASLRDEETAFREIIEKNFSALKSELSNVEALQSHLDGLPENDDAEKRKKKLLASYIEFLKKSQSSNVEDIPLPINPADLSTDISTVVYVLPDGSRSSPIYKKPASERSGVDVPVGSQSEPPQKPLYMPKNASLEIEFVSKGKMIIGPNYDQITLVQATNSDFEGNDAEKEQQKNNCNLINIEQLANHTLLMYEHSKKQNKTIRIRIDDSMSMENADDVKKRLITKLVTDYTFSTPEKDERKARFESIKQAIIRGGSATERDFDRYGISFGIFGGIKEKDVTKSSTAQYKEIMQEKRKKAAIEEFVREFNPFKPGDKYENNPQRFWRTANYEANIKHLLREYIKQKGALLSETNNDFNEALKLHPNEKLNFKGMDAYDKLIELGVLSQEIVDAREKVLFSFYRELPARLR